MWVQGGPAGRGREIVSEIAVFSFLRRYPLKPK